MRYPCSKNISEKLLFFNSRHTNVAITQNTLISFISLDSCWNCLRSCIIGIDILQTNNYKIEIEESSANSAMRGVVYP